MNPRTTLLRGAATLGVAAVLSGMASAPALAADGDVDVVNTETVQVYTSPTGEVDTQRVYEQLAMTGTGSVDVSNPISTDGLRNLDGFGGFDVEGGEQVTHMTVDGEEHLRTVSDFTGDLPLDVSVAYKLDGEAVEPGDVVGESGELEVLYTVKNITAEPQEVTFPDGNGGTTTETVDVPIPMVGSLTTTTPDTFTNVKSRQANMAGDGKGGTKLSFTMTLFPPIGSDTAEFGYTADIVDGVVPRADVSALPVNPLESPTFASAADSYQGGTETGAKLAEGAAKIDSNLLKLRDGASELLAGLIQLHEGSAKLQDGLANDAAPGAEKLADGAGRLDDGLGKIADGAGRLFDGTGRLVAGTGALTDGTGRLADGAARISDGAGKAAVGGRKLHEGAGKLNAGLGDLSGGALELDNGAGRILDGQKKLRAGLRLLESGVQGMPDSVRDQLATNLQYQALLAGMQKVVDGIGSPTDVTNPATGQPATLFGGLNAIRGGLFQTSLQLDGKLADIPANRAELSCASAVLTQLAGGAAAPAACGATGLPAVTSAVPQIEAAQRGTLNHIASGLSDGVQDLNELETSLTTLDGAIDTQFLPGIDRIKGGLNNPGANPNCAVGAATPSPADDCGVQQAVGFFKASMPTLVDGITGNISQTLLDSISVPSAGCDPNAPTLLCGGDALVAGSRDLKAGTRKLVAGSGELGAGGAKLYDKLGELARGLHKIDNGAGKLADGTGELDAGANKLANGAGELNAGAGKLAGGTAEASEGSGKLAAGADKLATGLDEAADGSGRLTDGLGQAREGAPKLVDGAQMLSDKGTSKLVEAGQDTTQTYGQMYATMQAGAERAQVEDMAYGAPEGAAGLTAYSYVIQGDDGETGRNWSRGLAGMALLGLGGAGLLLRRRLI